MVVVTSIMITNIKFGRINMSHSYNPLLRLLQLSSPTLPVGAYAYSQGAESAVNARVVVDDKSARAWIKDVLLHSLAYGDLALLSHFYQAWSENNQGKLTELVELSIALRETRELQQEDQHIAKALMRLAVPLGVSFPDKKPADITYTWGFSRFSQQWGIPLEDALQAFAWSWLENQVAAMIKLVPLGQTQGQIMLLGMDDVIQEAVLIARAVEMDEIGSSLPSLAILSSRHEIQYSRLFRS